MIEIGSIILHPVSGMLGMGKRQERTAKAVISLMHMMRVCCDRHTAKTSVTVRSWVEKARTGDIQIQTCCVLIHRNTLLQTQYCDAACEYGAPHIH